MEGDLCLFASTMSTVVIWGTAVNYRLLSIWRNRISSYHWSHYNSVQPVSTFSCKLTAFFSVRCLSSYTSEKGPGLNTHSWPAVDMDMPACFLQVSWTCLLTSGTTKQRRWLSKFKFRSTKTIRWRHGNSVHFLHHDHSPQALILPLIWKNMLVHALKTNLLSALSKVRFFDKNPPF